MSKLSLHGYLPFEAGARRRAKFDFDPQPPPQASRPGPIGAWTAVTPVTAVHPPFAFLWSAVKECFIGAPMDVAAALLRVLARKLHT